jgi:hypothetical protein
MLGQRLRYDKVPRRSESRCTISLWNMAFPHDITSKFRDMSVSLTITLLLDAQDILGGSTYQTARFYAVELLLANVDKRALQWKDTAESNSKR